MSPEPVGILDGFQFFAYQIKLYTTYKKTAKRNRLPSIADTLNTSSKSFLEIGF